ncbi:MAG: ATPase [Lachnospiraceae bacterium]|nr:ATPase [Lachnospiraceae bacterium]
MNTVIKRISEIEDAASAIMEGANASKKAFAQEMEERTREFDRDLEERTDQGIEEFRKRMESEMSHKQKQQSAKAEELLRRMEQNFEECHSQYVNTLFGMLTGE